MTKTFGTFFLRSMSLNPPTSLTSNPSSWPRKPRNRSSRAFCTSALLVGRLEIAARKPVGQVVDLGDELGPVSDAVLSSREAKVDQVHFHIHQLLIQIFTRLFDGRITDNPGQALDLARARSRSG